MVQVCVEAPMPGQKLDQLVADLPVLPPRSRDDIDDQPPRLGNLPLQVFSLALPLLERGSRQ